MAGTGNEKRIPVAGNTWLCIHNIMDIDEPVSSIDFPRDTQVSVFYRRHIVANTRSYPREHLLLLLLYQSKIWEVSKQNFN